MEDKASTDKIRQMFDSADYELIELNSAVALCRLGDASRLQEILALLESPDENFRGFIAGALGEIAHPDVVGALEGLIEKEKMPGQICHARKADQTGSDPNCLAQ